MTNHWHTLSQAPARDADEALTRQLTPCLGEVLVCAARVTAPDSTSGALMRRAEAIPSPDLVQNQINDPAHGLPYFPGQSQAKR